MLVAMESDPRLLQRSSGAVLGDGSPMARTASEELLRLHALTRKLLATSDVSSALREILDAAIGLQGADFGDIHVLDSGSGTLRLAAHRGLPAEYLAEFAEIRDDHFSACGRTLKSGRSVIIEDVDLDPDYAPMRQLAAQTGYRAVQATPLTDQSGALLGVLSLHFRQPCQPTGVVLNMLDLYARQAGDVIERLQIEQQLRAAYEEKKRFVAMLAHELRGPLGAVALALDMLDRAEVTPQAQRHATAIARRQIQVVVQLVNDLFDRARLNEDKLKLSRQVVRMDKLVELALDVVRSALEDAKLTLEVDLQSTDLTLLVDSTRFAQVIANLLANAAKFTLSGGQVYLRGHDEGDAIHIEVCDTGVGMSAQFASHVFEPFAQAVDEAGGNQGLGLGLPIARQIIELHGGTITAYSAGRGAGSTFSIMLPSTSVAPPSH